jgi:hypothetical protein
MVALSDSELPNRLRREPRIACFRQIARRCSPNESAVTRRVEPTLRVADRSENYRLMLPLTAALLLSLRRIRGSRRAIAIGPSTAIATAAPTTTTTTTTLAIPAAAASATSATAMPPMPASVAISAVSAISSIAPISAWRGWSSPVGYRARIIAAGAVGLRLAAVVALFSRLRLVVTLDALDALDALVGRSGSGAASIGWPAFAVWVVVLIVHNGAKAPRNAEHEKGG